MNNEYIYENKIDDYDFDYMDYLSSNGIPTEKVLEDMYEYFEVDYE